MGGKMGRESQVTRIGGKWVIAKQEGLANVGVR